MIRFARDYREFGKGGSKGKTCMANEFDPYREALVVEHVTLWPSDGYSVNREEKELVERTLHKQPQLAAELTYLRLATGFVRCIKVTLDDISRILGQVASSPSQDQDTVEQGHG
jgi:hypothetical protein